MAKKEYRRHIRINGKMKKSPKGLSKVKADLWYSKMLEQKVSQKAGVYFTSGSGPTLNEYFYSTWFPRRQDNNIASTWGADKQRYKDYVEDQIGYLKIASIDMIQVRACLKRIVDFHKLSPKTRERVRALVSKIFKDAFNEEMPLVNTNPVHGIKFDDKRTGKKTPKHLKKQSEIHKYLSAAKSLSLTHLTYALLGLGAGLRKQEMIPLKWKDWDDENHQLDINKRFIQASSEILSGSKSGTDQSREVPISDEVEAVLKAHSKSTPFYRDNDFILSKLNGKHFGPRDIARLNNEICEKAGVEINPHGLRHSFGRLYAIGSGGNLKALQTVLGHSTISVTEIYATLAGEQVKDLRNVVKIGGKNE